MIETISLQNFKCFRDLDLPMAPLTLLAGMNGVGKSSVIQALLVLRQSFLSGSLSEGMLDLTGELIGLGTGGEILLDGADEDILRFALEWRRRNGEASHAEFSFNYDSVSDRLNNGADSNLAENIGSGDDICPLFAETFHYLHAERVGPRKTLPLSELRVRRRDLGSCGEYVLHYLLTWGEELLRSNDPRINKHAKKFTLLAQVIGWLHDVSPGTQLDIHPMREADAAIARFSFSRPGDVPTRPLRPTNVGFGLSYTLPVIVALLTVRPSELVVIENPEAHLHPRGQTQLGQLAAKAARSGAQVLIETHSDHFMNGIRLEIKAGRLPPDWAAFHYFEREGESFVITPTLDKDARLSDWPNGFFDQHEKNLAQLIRPKG